MPQYQVGYVYTDRSGQPGAWTCYRIHSDGAAAAADLKRLAAAHPFVDGCGYRWSIKRCRDDGLPEDWREREQCRFDKGLYERVPWDGADWADRHPDHFVHLSTDDPGKLAYTENEKKGEADRQTRILPGRYLQRFYGDVLTAEQIEQYACEVTVAAGAFTLTITQDADEIEDVYEHGPRSCMSGSADNFDGPCHPARVYAGPDLGLAYLGCRTDATARCVVWPEKKIYGTTYGDGRRLRMLLEAQGYSPGGVDGARIRKIAAGGGEYVMPYIDDANGASVDGDYIRLGGYELETGNTHGLSGHSGAECDRCGDRYDPDYGGYYLESIEESWCESCVNYHAVYCEISEQYYPHDRVTVVDVIGPGYGYSRSAVEEAIEDHPDYLYDAERDEWWHRPSHELCQTIQALAVAFCAPAPLIDLAA